MYQTESFLRRRILQELEILSDSIRPRTEDSDPTSKSEGSDEGSRALFIRLSSERVKAVLDTGSISQATLANHASEQGLEGTAKEGTFDPPSALLDFTLPSSSKEKGLVQEGKISTLITYHPSNLEGFGLQHLPPHRIPIYSIASLFQLDNPSSTGGEDEKEKRPKKAQQQQDQSVSSWSSVRDSRPDVYERELAACQTQLEDFQRLVSSLTTSSSSLQGDNALQGTIVALPSKSKSVLPLLIALWRYRMWMGEGWSGDGFGVLEATGRKTPYAAR